LPGRAAFTLQSPVDTSVAVVPETVQIRGVREVNVGGRPDVDVADSVTNDPTVLSAACVNEIVWFLRKPITRFVIP
jgi:hypothetical protein